MRRFSQRFEETVQNVFFFKKIGSVHDNFSDKKFMGMIDRYKKKGGFLQLLNLIETSGKQKQEQFLGLISQESKAWEEGIKKYMLSIDRILGWDAGYRAEIFSRTQPLTLATVLHGMPPEKVESILSCMGSADKRKIMNVISERNPTPAEKSTCSMKLITEVRGFCAGGIIKLEKADPEIAIPETIEEMLNNQVSEPKGEELVFPDFSANVDKKPGDAPKDAKAGHSSEEVDFLKRKVNQLSQELASAKHELNVARGKLDQIKKIA